MCSTCAAHLILIDHPNNLVTNTHYEAPNYSFLQPPVTSSLLGPNFLLRILFSVTVSLYSTPNMRNQVSQLYKITGKIIVVCAISVIRYRHTSGEVFLICTLTEVFLTLTEVFLCFFLSCRANTRVKLTKTGYGPHSSTLVICVVWLLLVLFYVLFVCKCVLPPGDNPIAVNKYTNKKN